MGARIIPLRALADPAEEIHRIRVRLEEISEARLRRWHEETLPTVDGAHGIKNRFLDGDLTVRSGRRKGQPLTRDGRERLLEELMQAQRKLERGRIEERELEDEKGRLEAQLEVLRAGRSRSVKA